VRFHRLIQVGVAGAVMAAVVPATAQAAGNLHANCQFTGGTTSMSPPMQYQGGSGSFTFSGTADCAGIDGDGVLGPTEFLLKDLSMSASGTYTNTVCGTSTWTFSSIAVSQLGRGQILSLDGVSATFADGTGPLRGTFAGTNDAINDAPQGGGAFVILGDDSGNLRGRASFRPAADNQQGFPPNGPCVTHADVEGTFSLDSTV
jgi:hypothetical protein